jgi:hypothetical protein
MRSRHAAALALVGWYLMTPPGPDTGQRTAVSSARGRKRGDLLNELRQPRSRARQINKAVFDRGGLGVESHQPVALGRVVI